MNGYKLLACFVLGYALSMAGITYKQPLFWLISVVFSLVMIQS